MRRKMKTIRNLFKQDKENDMFNHKDYNDRDDR